MILLGKKIAKIGKRFLECRGGYGGLIILALIFPLFPIGPYYIHIAIYVMAFVISVSSLRTISISGQISVAHASFMGIGAYTSALLSIKLGWTPWVTMILGAIIAMIIAAFIGYAFGRLRTIYFALVTIFLGVAIEATIRMMRKLTGGPAGLVGFPTLNNIEIPGLLQIEFATSKVPFYYFFLGLTIFSLIILYRLEQSRIGMNWKAIAQSSLVASSVGINETKSRVIGFAIGCLFAGLAGSSFAHYTGVLTPTSFNLLKSIELVIYMLFGGTGRFAGPIIGVVVLVTIPEVFRGLAEYAPFVLGGLMLVVVFLMPEGLVGLLGRDKTD